MLPVIPGRRQIASSTLGRSQVCTPAICRIASPEDLIATIPGRLARIMAQYANIKVFPPPTPFPKSRTSLYWHERFHREPGNVWLRISRNVTAGSAPS